MTIPTGPAARQLNRAAAFHPMRAEGELPALEVAGALVFGYVDPRDGTLTVSVDLDTTDPDLIRDGDESSVPLRITVQGAPVFDDSDAARAARIKFTDPTSFREWLARTDRDLNFAAVLRSFTVHDLAFWNYLGHMLSDAMADGAFRPLEVDRAFVALEDNGNERRGAAVVVLNNGLRLMTRFFTPAELCGSHTRGIDAAAAALANLYDRARIQVDGYRRARLHTGS